MSVTMYYTQAQWLLIKSKAHMNEYMHTYITAKHKIFFISGRKMIYAPIIRYYTSFLKNLTCALSNISDSIILELCESHNVSYFAYYELFTNKWNIMRQSELNKYFYIIAYFKKQSNIFSISNNYFGASCIT